MSLHTLNTVQLACVTRTFMFLRSASSLLHDWRIGHWTAATCFLCVSRLPFNNFEPPEYLDGSLRKSRRNVSFAPVCCPSRHFVTRFSCNIAAAGDRGFDPLRLGATWGNPPDESDSSQSRIGWLVGC